MNEARRRNPRQERENEMWSVKISVHCHWESKVRNQGYVRKFTCECKPNQITWDNCLKSHLPLSFNFDDWEVEIHRQSNDPKRDSTREKVAKLLMRYKRQQIRRRYQVHLVRKMKYEQSLEGIPNKHYERVNQAVPLIPQVSSTPLLGSLYELPVFPLASPLEDLPEPWNNFQNTHQNQQRVSQAFPLSREVPPISQNSGFGYLRGTPNPLHRGQQHEDLPELWNNFQNPHQNQQRVSQAFPLSREVPPISQNSGFGYLRGTPNLLHRGQQHEDLPELWNNFQNPHQNQQRVSQAFYLSREVPKVSSSGDVGARWGNAVAFYDGQMHDPNSSSSPNLESNQQFEGMNQTSPLIPKVKHLTFSEEFGTRPVSLHRWTPLSNKRIQNPTIPHRVSVTKYKLSRPMTFQGPSDNTQRGISDDTEIHFGKRSRQTCDVTGTSVVSSVPAKFPPTIQSPNPIPTPFHTPPPSPTPVQTPLLPAPPPGMHIPDFERLDCFYVAVRAIGTSTAYYLPLANIHALKQVLSQQTTFPGFEICTPSDLPSTLKILNKNNVHYEF